MGGMSLWSFPVCSERGWRMLRKVFPVLTALILGSAGCSLLGGGGLGIGDTAEGDLTTGAEIEELIPNSEEVLLAAGIAVEKDWPALQFPLKSGDGLSLFIEADGIDPVMVVIDTEGKVLTAGDDWDGELDAFISLSEVPDGAKVIVFDISGDDGTFLLAVSEAEDYQWALEQDNEQETFILGDKENKLMSDLLTGISEMYRENWDAGRVFPLEISGAKWVRLAVVSDADCVMAVVKIDGNDLEYVDYDDDTDGMNPGFAGELEAGSYLVVVDTYAGSTDAELTVSYTELDPDEMSVEIVAATEQNMLYSGTFREGGMVLSYWPEAADYYGILPEEQAVVFEFEIEEQGDYTFDAICTDDTKLAIIDSSNVMIEYNDDGPVDFNPQLNLSLAPGSYSAIVTPYSQSSSGLVEFRYFASAPVVRETFDIPMEDTFSMNSNKYMSLVFEAGNTYEIFAESDIDLTLTVVDAAGVEYFSDDDGGNLNPLLEIECTRANAGTWEIDLASYYNDYTNGEVYFVARPIQGGRTTSSNSSVGIDI
jgi:hypothetical protein